jgi:phosphoserine phosphatase
MIIASDLEGTLTTGETWRGIRRYIKLQGETFAFRRFYYSWFPVSILVRVKLMGAQHFRMKFMLDLLKQLRGYTSADWQKLADWVVGNELWPKRREAVVQEISDHLKRGHRVIIVSGAYQPILDVFAGRIGAEAMGTVPEIANGASTGRPQGGRMNVGQSKVERLRAALDGQDLAMAYGDTLADVPMLQLSKQAVAVYPDRALHELALHSGWRILGQPAS